MQAIREGALRIWAMPLALLGLALVLGLAAGGAPAAASFPSASTSLQTATSTPITCTENYTYTISTGIIITGTTLVPGSQCSGCTASVALPFPFAFYGTPYNTANVSSDGNLQFVTANVSEDACPLPGPLLGPAILPHWDASIDTDPFIACEQYIGSPCGIYTSVSGAAPNRIFNIEWRAHFRATSQHTANFEIRMYEAGGRIDFVYAWISYGGGNAGVGLQDGAARYTSYACGVWGSLYRGLLITWQPPPCGPTYTPTPTRTPTATRTGTPGCGTDWHAIPSPNQIGSNLLYSVDAISSNDVWAVGFYRDLNFIDHTLTMHWNGAQWSIVPSPGTGFLTGVDALAPNDVWAVGHTGSGGPSIILHWDGSDWTEVAHPNTGQNPSLNGVKAVSANDVWAAGYFYNPDAQALLLHWNGAAWSIVQGSDPSLNRKLVYAIDGVSSNDLWAAGVWEGRSVMLHWNGSAWSNFTVPNLGHLLGLGAISSNDVWAVSDGGALHWNGTAWDAVASSILPLYDVDGLSANDVWAVGYEGIVHWDGTAWNLASEPDGGTLRGVSALSTNDVWAVGYNSQGTLVQRYYDPCTLPTNTPTAIGSPPTSTATRTPTATITPRPGCCVDVSLTASGACAPGYANSYDTGYTFTNDCSTAQTGSRTFYFEMAASENGPWVPYLQSNPATRTYQPGNYSETYGFYYWVVPPEYDWFRARVTVAEQTGCWVREAVSQPARLCRPGTPTSTASPARTTTPLPTLPGGTGTPTAMATASATPIPTTTPCPLPFSDVQATDYFYEAVRYLYCTGVVSGYSDGTFRPYNSTTRGQLTKIVVLGFGIALYTPPTPTFTDVPSTHTFYQYIETAAFNGIVSGYSDGTFRPGNDVTRGQLSKIVVEAAQWPLVDPQTPTFSDVPMGHAFYLYIETAYDHQIISGYSDGTFRPGNNATRGQICKIVYNAVTPP